MTRLERRTIQIVAVVVVVIVIGAGIGSYVYFRSRPSSGCTLGSTNPLVIDQAEGVSSFDPQHAFSTPEWGAVQQVYQTLIMYNGTSYTTYTPVLAKNWTTSADRFHWNFTLVSGVHFSNGDPFNVYVMWYSLYRLLALQGIDQYLLAENFYYPQVGYYSPTAQKSASLANLTNDLNTFSFSNPSASQIAVMGADNQSFRVLTPTTLQVNLGFGYLGVVPYTYLLAELATPGAAAVDPIVITQNGGVNGPTNAYLVYNAVGTGPYVLVSGSFDPTIGYTIAPDPNYWGLALAKAEPWNNNLQPAKASIQVVFQADSPVNVQNLKTGAAAAASFAYLGPSTIHDIIGAACINVVALNNVASGASGSWWVYMNQTVPPFNNFSVREAVTHAIDYNTLMNLSFGGYAVGWVGPVGFGHPYYNPSGLQPYQYNLPLAKQEMANSPWPTGYPTPLNFMYLNTGPDWVEVATILKSELANIGININPEPISIQNFYVAQTLDPSTGQCISTSTSFGGPYYMGLDFYASDYISPDDWTQQDVLSYGSANICMSGYYNPAMDALVIKAAGENNATNLTQDYALMTKTMYDNYTNAWLAVPTLFDAYNPLLQGLYVNPMGSTTITTMSYNTVYAT